MNLYEYRLCLILDDRAYFTTVPLEDVWGSDWDNKPYYCNAGVPSSPHFTLHFDGYYWRPGDSSNYHYSVADINALAAPWLYAPDADLSLYANATLRQFIDFIFETDGVIYTPLNKQDTVSALCVMQP